MADVAPVSEAGRRTAASAQSLERRDATSAEARRDAAPERREAPAAQVPERHDAATAETPARVAMARPLPPPQTPQETDDTQSVLARLRQLSPGAPAVSASVPARRSDKTSTPPLSGLIAARSALASGQIEDARRLMQQAQLQLVFRPMEGSGTEPEAAAKGASDVARALEALSANDVPRSRRFVDVAIGDLSGIGMKAPVQESGVRSTGYAPAYPSRQ